MDEALAEADAAVRYGDSLGPSYAAVLQAEVLRLRGAVERVRELHRPISARPVCAICVEVGQDEGGDGTLFEWSDPVPYPCPTVRALEGA